MNSRNYDIETLTGDESEYIEMDLMPGVADLNTLEAIAAAKAAIVGAQPVISADASSSESEIEEDSIDYDSCSDSGDDINDETYKGTYPPIKSKGQIFDDKSTNAMSENGQKRKRPNIVELS